jgi:hypothetical protein
MPTVKISDLTELTATPASDDLVVVVDSSTNETKKITYDNLLENVSSDTLTVATTATFSGATVADGGTVTTVDINGGTIDGSIIGGTTSAAGSFTTLSASGDVNFDSNTLFVDASANAVGIGTSSPTASVPLTIVSDSGNAIAQNIRGRSDGIGVLLFSDNSDVENGRIDFRTNYADIKQTRNAPLIFSTNNTERMRIDSSGNVGIGVSSPIASLDVVAGADDRLLVTNSSGDTFLSSVNAANTAYNGLALNGSEVKLFTNASERMRIDSSGTTLFNTTTVPAAGVDGVSINGSTNPRINMGFASNLGVFISFFGSSAQVGSISTSGGSTTYSTSSDYRLKENVAEMSGSVDRVKSMNPVRFNFAGESQTVDGFLAHEIQAIVPEAVVGEKDAVDDDGNPIYQGIDQSKLVPVLVAAIKELTARIEALEAGA